LFTANSWRIRRPFRLVDIRFYVLPIMGSYEFYLKYQGDKGRNSADDQPVAE